MSNRKPGPLDGTLEEAVARAANVSMEDASEFLSKRDIRAQALIPRPVSVTVKAVRFNGIKSIHGVSEPFSFEWEPLGPGFWLIGSEGNSKGKTTLIAIIRWMLRGKQPGSITDTVRKWIEHAELDFDIGGQAHRTILHLQDVYSARVLRVTEAEENVVIDASAPDGFESAMSEYMMSQLQMERIINVRGDLQGTVQHAWPSLFSAFHVGTDYSCLLGSSAIGGLPTRMLNMFAGFTHASAVAKIQVVIANLEQDAERANSAQRAVASHARGRLERLESELAGLGQPTGTEVSAQDALAAVRDLSARLSGLYARVADARRVATEADATAREAHGLMNEDKLVLRMFIEARASSTVFRALTPSCCPRCDQRLASDRLEREKSELACMVCGEEAPTEERGDPAAERGSLEAALAASQQADAAAKKDRTAAVAAVGRLEKEVAQAEQDLSTERAKQASTGAAAATRERRLVLEAMISEMRSDTNDDESGIRTPKTGEGGPSGRLQQGRSGPAEGKTSEVLHEVQDEVLRLLRSFGVADLDEVELISNMQLKLNKGGATTNYGRLSPGERLRSKIALVVALMKVAHRRGIGRHPSLLFIDTPGAQETADKDLRALAAGLAALRTELPQLQIFVATTRLAEFEDAVPPECRRIASGGASLW